LRRSLFEGIEPESLVEIELVTNGGTVVRTADGFKAALQHSARLESPLVVGRRMGLPTLNYRNRKSKKSSAKSIPGCRETNGMSVANAN